MQQLVRISGSCINLNSICCGIIWITTTVISSIITYRHPFIPPHLLYLGFAPSLSSLVVCLQLIRDTETLSLSSDVCPLLNLTHPISFCIRGKTIHNLIPRLHFHHVLVTVALKDSLRQITIWVGEKKSLERLGSRWQVIVIHSSYNANMIWIKMSLPYKGEK